MLAIFFVPYKKPYINKSGFMLSPIYFCEEYKFKKVIEEYELKLLEKSKDPESYINELTKMSDKQSNLKTDKEKLEYYSWLGVPNHIKRDMIRLKKGLFITELIIILSAGIFTYILFCIVLEKHKKRKENE